MATLLTTLRSFPWRQKIRLRWLIMAAALCGALAVGGLLALRVLRPAAPAQILPGQTLATDIAAAVARGAGVQAATGAYLPGDRIILYARIDEAELARVRSWALVQLEPFAERLAAMPAQEGLTWLIDYGPAPAEQELLVAPLRRANSPAAYTYVSAAPALLAAPTVAATAAAAPPLNEPAPVPTAAPVATAAGAPAPTAPPAAAPAAPAAGAPPEAATPLLSTGFDGAGQADTLWRPLAGDWAVVDGAYAQRNLDGYDFLSLLDLPPQAHYSIETRLRLDGGTMGGGIIYNAPDPASRSGAQLVDLDQGGAFLRWGHYDAVGTYRYDGGVALEPSIGDGQWHTLRVVTHAAASTIWLDGREVAQVSNISAAGHVGLSTSQARVTFDDVALLALPEGAGPPAATASAAPDAALAGLSDDFADGDAKGWQVLSGTWQTQDGAYRQSSVGGSDLSSISQFQGASYTATVRLQRLDGAMGGGLLFNLARRDSKARSQIVNYTEGGKALQWGHFDEGGNFVFEGSAAVPDGSDGDWHTLTVVVAGGEARVVLDGEEVAAGVALTYTSGYVGLVASNGSAAFDDVQIVAQ